MILFSFDDDSANAESLMMEQAKGSTQNHCLVHPVKLMSINGKHVAFAPQV